jgi:hypothetical protein
MASFVFRGTTFPDYRFVECESNNCRFIKDTFDGNCDFERAVAYSCKLSNCEGFGANPLLGVEPSRQYSVCNAFLNESDDRFVAS